MGRPFKFFVKVAGKKMSIASACKKFRKVDYATAIQRIKRDPKTWTPLKAVTTPSLRGKKKVAKKAPTRSLKKAARRARVSK